MAENSQPPAPPPPPGNFSAQHMMPSIIVDAALPAVSYWTLSYYGVSTISALTAVSIFPAAKVALGWLRAHRLDLLGIIALGFIFVGVAASLISGNIFFALIKGSLLTATFGLICLASLMWERPLMFYTGRQFVAGNDPGRLDWWNSLWQYEIFRSSQKFITTVWGVGYLAEATARVAMALLFRPAIVVAVSPTIAAAVTIGLVSWTVRYGRSMRERGQRLHELARENRIS